jgi:hypothetical protein
LWGWARLYRRFTRLRWSRDTLSEVWVLYFAIGDEFRIDLGQGLASSEPLRRSSHDWNDTIYKKAIAGFGISAHKARLLARCHDLDTGWLARRRLHQATRS